MEIQAVSYKNFYNQRNLKTETYNLSFCSSLSSKMADTFIHSKHSLLENALLKLKKINLAEYKNLTNEEIQLLRTEVDKMGAAFVSDISKHHYAAESIKQAFDKEYGEGNYVVVAIGRSLSSVSKLLSLKIGEERVKNIPLSGLSRFSTRGMNAFNKFASEEEKQNYKEFLNSVGLSKEEIEKSDKRYIVLDYVYTGRSLKNAYKILTSDFYLGNKKRNVSFVSVADILPMGYISENLVFQSNLLTGTYKEYSFVDHLPSPSIQNLHKAMDYEQFCKDDESKIKKHKLFGFALLDTEIQGKESAQYENLDFYTNIMSYPEQENVFWNGLNKQFKEDIFTDKHELEKAILRNKDNNGMVDILERLNAKLNRKIKPDIYYSELRPVILQVLQKTY